MATTAPLLAGRLSPLGPVWRLLGPLVQLVRVLFTPRLVLIRILAVAALSLGLRTVRYGWARLQRLNDPARLTRLRAELEGARSYVHWHATARRLDTNDPEIRAWKAGRDSQYFEGDILNSRTGEYKRLLAERNVPGLMFCLRAQLMRLQFGLGDPRMWAKCYHGARACTEEYAELVAECVDFVSGTTLEATDEQVQERVGFFTDTSHSFGSTALMLSGGGGMGLYHVGLCKALWEHQLLPNIISGSSAGSIIAACVTTDHNVQATLFDPETYNQALIEHINMGPGAISRRIRRFFSSGVLLDSAVLERALRHLLGDITFEQAYLMTGRVVNITVNGPGAHQPARLLNYLTHPNVLLWSACLASCALNGVFAPVELMQLDVRSQL